MSGFDPGRLRWRLLIANLAVAVAAIAAIVVGVWVFAPRAFEDAMGRAGMMSGPMMGAPMMGATTDGMMDPLLRAAFGDAVGGALLLGLGAAVAVAVVGAVVLSSRISQPIADLSEASRRVAHGDYTRPVAAAPGELGELAASFNGMAAALAATEQRRRDLVADVAHELRTPIASLRGYVEGLQAGVFEPGPDAWRVLEEQSARLERLVDDLTTLWQADTSDLRLAPEPVDGAAVVRDVWGRHLAAAASRSLELAAGETVPVTVVADRVRLGQVLDNLVGNAVRYTPAGGHVVVELTRDGAWAAFTVRDDGPGLTPGQLDLVFDRFYRADPSRSREAGGSGLGLAISRSLVEAMGGSLAARSPGPGRGTTMVVRLPALPQGPDPLGRRPPGSAG